MIELNRIYNEDCFEGMKRIPDGSVDLIVTDPPYASTCLEWDKPIDIPAMFKEFLRVCKGNAAIVIFSQLPFAVDLINSQRKLFRYEWIWEKQLGVGFYHANQMPLRAHENILIFYRHLPTYNPQFTKGSSYTRKVNGECINYIPRERIPTISDGNRYPRDVVKFNRQPSNHPTAKPLELVKYLIKTYSNEDEIVLDAFAGSGTTAVACLETNRKYICFEKESRYCEVAADRIRKYYEKPQQTQLAI